jgi:hypothetical protein
MENQRVAPDSRDHLGNETVVLMRVVDPRRKYKVCMTVPRDILQLEFDLFPSPRKSSIW